MKLIRENYRVIVDCEIPLGVGGVTDIERHGLFLRAAEALQKEIKRHVDGFTATVVDWDNRYLCEHCGYPWDDPKSPYNDCCEKSCEPESAP